MIKGAVEFYAAEALEIHSLCDRCGVPREADGEPWSMGQRVAYLVGQNKALKAAMEVIAQARGSRVVCD